MGRSCYLLAVRLSPTLEKELIDIQKECFAETRIPGALALPPLYPLSYTPAPFDDQGMKRMEWGATKSFTFRSYSAEGRIVYASMDPGDPFPPYGDGRGMKQAEAAGFLGPFPGFFIGVFGKSMPSLPAPPKNLVRVVRIVSLRIEYALTGTEWWEGIEYTEEGEKWIKTV